MKQILLILLLITFSSCLQGTEVIVEKWKYQEDQPFQKDFRGPEWASVPEFAVYGWFKIDSSLHAPYFNGFILTTQENFSNVHEFPPVRIFNVWSGEDRFLEVGSVTSAGGNPFKYPHYTEEEDKWVFFFFSKNQNSNLLNYFFKFPIREIFEPFTAYILHVGKPILSMDKFNGEFRNFRFQYGPGAYQDSNYQRFYEPLPEFAGGKKIPDGGNQQNQGSNEKVCPIFYSECNYQGNSISLCEKKPISYENIKSIKIPPKYQVKIPHSTDSTLEVIYTKNVDCIQSKQEMKWQKN